MSFSYTKKQLQGLTELALDHAKKLGASDCVADVSESVGLSVNVRCGEIETIEHTRDKSLGVSVYLGQRRGHAASSDFSEDAVIKAVQAALDIAKFTAEDDCAGLPEDELLESRPKNLDLYHPWDIDTEKAVELALVVEGAALDTSPMIRNSDGASVSTEAGHFVAANSRGFRGGYPYSRHSFGVSPIAQAKNSKQSPMHRDYWYSSSRVPSELADPRDVGAYAAHRALSRLGARTVPTQQCPVLFEAPLACGLLGSFVQAVSGGALYRQSSFLLDHLGQSVWADHIDVTENPHVKRAMGSAPFDEEGVKTAPRQIVKGGVLEAYFLSCYTARKLGMKTTGNAGGSHNLILKSRLTKKGDDLSAMLKKMGTGLFVTELMGQGINYVTGDYSRGVFGYWVENGVIVHPVEEVTIAGNLAQMFKNVVAIGSDTLTRGTKHCGSLLIDNMTVASSQ